MQRRRELHQSKNRLLAGLPPKDYNRLQPHFESVSFPLSHLLFRSGEPVRYVYFPEDAVVSLVNVMQEGQNIEVGLVGREGVAGIEAILGARTYEYNAVIQAAGSCLKVEARLLQSEFSRDGILLEGLHGYFRQFLRQVSQTAACNGLHRLPKRLARWLLMTHDRVGKDVFPATHEFLSNMLGANRSEVTLAAGVLRRAGHLSYSRGMVTILDRKSLESATCECYGVVRDRRSQEKLESSSV
jgi:CRP-like cAMP-binding protein